MLLPLSGSLVLVTAGLAQEKIVILNGDTVATTKDEHVYKLIEDFLQEGYPFITIDTVMDSGKEYFALESGTKMHYQIRNVLQDSGIKINSRASSPVEMLDHLVSSGFPFASVSVIPVEIEGDNFLMDLVINRNQLIRNDTIKTLNAHVVTSTHLADILDLRFKEPFNENSFQSIRRKIEEVPYLTLTSSPDLSFSNGFAKIFLPLEEIKSSSFSGILGLQSIGMNSFLTGVLDVKLSNLFKSGKALDFKWNRFQPLSQTLVVNAFYPYLLHSKVGLGASIDVIKQDTLFTTRQTGVKVSVETNKIPINFHFKRFNSFGFSEDWESLSTNWYGIAIGNPSRKSNTRKSEVKYNFDLAMGDRRSSTSSDLENVEEKRIFRIEASGNIQKPFATRSAIVMQVNHKNLLSQNLYQAELYRIGGLNSIRGFNENEFYSTRLNLGQLEYRFYFEKSSYLLLFSDFGNFQNLDKTDILFGSLGGGFELDTSNGVFTFIFAAGKTNRNPINITESKIHFGYKSLF